METTRAVISQYLNRFDFLYSRFRWLACQQLLLFPYSVQHNKIRIMSKFLHKSSHSRSGLIQFDPLTSSSASAKLVPALASGRRVATASCLSLEIGSLAAASGCNSPGRLYSLSIQQLPEITLASSPNYLNVLLIHWNSSEIHLERCSLEIGWCSDFFFFAEFTQHTPHIGRQCRTRSCLLNIMQCAVLLERV